MAQRATSLGPKPSLFFWFLFFVCCFFFFWFLFFFLFKGQVMWPKGPPHLALNPPYLFTFCFFVLFLFFFFFFLCLFFICFLNRKTLFFPLKKAIVVYLSVFPFVSL